MSLNCLFIFIHPFIPESPRWLVSGRKFGEAGKLINEIRKKMIKIILTLFVITINATICNIEKIIEENNITTLNYLLVLQEM